MLAGVGKGDELMRGSGHLGVGAVEPKCSSTWQKWFSTRLSLLLFLSSFHLPGVKQRLLPVLLSDLSAAGCSLAAWKCC